MNSEQQNDVCKSRVAKQRTPDGLGEQAGTTGLGVPPTSRQEQLSVKLELTRLADEIYQQFAGWPETTQREKLDQFASAGDAAVVPLLRILESYRTPVGAVKAVPFPSFGRACLAERCLGAPT